MYTFKPVVYLISCALLFSNCALFKSDNNNQTTDHKETTVAVSATPSPTVNNKTASSTVKDTIVWNELIHDFKDVPTGPEATTKFYFINKTNRPIKITKVNPGCSCTATDFTKDEIAANDTGFINAAYKTSNTFGHFRKHIDVYLNNESKGYHLILTGNVDPMKSVK